MDVGEAIRTAKAYVSSVFSDEGLANLRLEEVEFDDAARTWNITLGFSREMRESLGGLGMVVRRSEPDYKVVRINDSNAKVLSVKNRDPNG